MIAKFTSSGEMVFSSYLGGTGDDGATCITVASDNNVYVSGTTNSYDFPFSSSGFLSENQGSLDSFIARVQDFNLVSNTYIGGTLSEQIPNLFNVNDRLFITGSTKSSSGIALNASHQQEYAGGGDGYFGEFSSDLSNLIHSSYCGGEEDDDIFAGSGFEQSFYLIGKTLSPGLASPNAYQNEIYEEDVLNDFILYQFDLDGNYLHSTYLGGEGQDIGTAVWAIPTPK